MKQYRIEILKAASTVAALHDALKWSHRDRLPSQKDFFTALKAAGLTQRPNLAEAQEAYTDIMTVRHNRACARYIAKEVPLSTKLNRIRYSAVLGIAVSAVRYGASGGYSHKVVVTHDPAKIGYQVEMAKNWNTYKGKFRSYAASEDHHRIIVPYNWRLRVERRGLALLDGMMTLDASPCDGAPAGIDLFAAVWVEQGRGYSVNVERGYIAISTDRCRSFHGATAFSAVSGLLRKIRAGAALKAAAEAGALGVDAFVERFSRHADEIVKLSDARAIGACDYGIRSWCHATGLDYTKGQERLGVILNAYRSQPMPEARAAVIYAVQRMRVGRMAVLEASAA